MKHFKIKALVAALALCNLTAHAEDDAKETTKKDIEVSDKIVVDGEIG